MQRQDYATAVAKFRPLAAQGNATAQLMLGQLYLDGSGVPQDDALALAWVRKGAEQSDPAAQNYLGMMYRDGEGVTVDYAQAMKWFRKAADNGSAAGQDNVGSMYQLGQGVPRDYAEAMRWFRKASEQSNAAAQNDLGVLYINGWGAPQDFAQAMQWFRKAAAQGNAAAQGHVGWMYLQGQGVPRDFSEGQRWIRKAALQGDPSAQNNLGVIYRDGEGVAKDDVQAANWFRKAAQQGNAPAEDSLGWMYHQGNGVPKDDALALQWVRKAAAQDDPYALNNLGVFYRDGNGVPPDRVEATQWFRKAAERGNAWAKINLAAMEGRTDSPRLAASPAIRFFDNPARVLTAGATVLKDDIVYTVATDGTYSMDESVMVRVNLAQAVQEWAQAYLSYSSALEDVQVIEAYSIDKSGKRLNVAPDKIVTQQSPISTAAPTFGDIKIKAIVFSSVEPGSITAFHVLKTVRKPLFAGQFSMTEYFPTTREVKESSVTLIAPASLHVQVQAVGMQGGAVPSDKAKSNKWVWTLHDAKPEVEESASVSPMDYSPRVVATSFANYTAAANAYIEGADPAAKVTQNVRTLAEQITKGMNDPRAKAKAIYNWVSHEIRYVSLTFGLGGVVPHNADAILAARYGDCKDHAVLLQALLAAVGIRSSPVLVNATNVYWQPDVAILPGVFDHCITYLPQFNLFVDSTAQVAPFGVLPPTEAGKPALVARGPDGKPVLVRLPLTAPAHEMTKVTMVATMAADGSVTGSTITADTGVFELLDRAVASSVPAGQESQVAGSLLAQFGAPGTGTLSLGDPRNLDKPYTYSASFSLPAYASVPGPGAFTIPIGVPSISGIVSFPAQTVLPTREHPMTCMAGQRIEDSTLSLPANLKVKQLPPAVHMANGIVRYEAIYSEAGQSISVHRELTLAPKSVPCSPADYEQMHALGAVVARDMRAQVVY